MSMIVVIAFVATILALLLLVDLRVDRVVTRVLFRLVDWLPPFRPGGRYRLQSASKMYASSRNRRDES
jgi:hypothetical protein